jgi:hypothetical protein
MDIRKVKDELDSLLNTMKKPNGVKHKEVVHPSKKPMIDLQFLSELKEAVEQLSLVKQAVLQCEDKLSSVLAHLEALNEDKS